MKKIIYLIMLFCIGIASAELEATINNQEEALIGEETFIILTLTNPAESDYIYNVSDFKIHLPFENDKTLNEIHMIANVGQCNEVCTIKSNDSSAVMFNYQTFNAGSSRNLIFEFPDQNITFNLNTTFNSIIKELMDVSGDYKVFINGSSVLAVVENIAIENSIFDRFSVSYESITYNSRLSFILDGFFFNTTISKESNNLNFTEFKLSHSTFKTILRTYCKTNNVFSDEVCEQEIPENEDFTNTEVATELFVRLNNQYNINQESFGFDGEIQKQWNNRVIAKATLENVNSTIKKVMKIINNSYLKTPLSLIATFEDFSFENISSDVLDTLEGDVTLDFININQTGDYITYLNYEDQYGNTARKEVLIRYVQAEDDVEEVNVTEKPVFINVTNETEILILKNTTAEHKINLSVVNNSFILNALNITRETFQAVYKLQIQNDVIITGSDNWDGTLLLPQEKAFVDFKTTTNVPVLLVIEMGFQDERLNFSKPVKITFANMSGNKAAYNTIQADLTPIKTICNNIINPTNIPTASECYGNDGKDLVIWSYHLTYFAVYTPEPTPPEEPGETTTDIGGSGGGNGRFHYTQKVVNETIEENVTGEKNNTKPTITYEGGSIGIKIPDEFGIIDELLILNEKISSKAGATVKVKEKTNPFLVSLIIFSTLLVIVIIYDVNKYLKKKKEKNE